jgi:hypothetical protein
MRIFLAVLFALFFCGLFSSPSYAFRLVKDGREIVRSHVVSGKYCEIEIVRRMTYIRNCDFR